jgi:hypothetical protein
MKTALEKAGLGDGDGHTAASLEHLVPVMSEAKYTFTFYFCLLLRQGLAT